MMAADEQLTKSHHDSQFSPLLMNADVIANGYHDNIHHHGDRYHALEDEVEAALPSISSRYSYPYQRPFIYDKYQRSELKPDKAFPENNRQAVMKALKSLQDKMKQLELERADAERNLKALATETSRYRDILHHDPVSANHRDILHRDPVSANQSLNIASSHIDESHKRVGDNSKLDEAEQRCKLLEKQLDCMRNMVQNAEHDRTNAVRQSSILQQEREELEQEELRNQLAKITDLERDHLKLTATQTIAENKIRELEEKLQEERHYRKMMQSRTAELETVAQTQRILQDATNSHVNRPKKLKKKKKATSTATPPNSGRINKLKVNSAKQPGQEPGDHYRLNLAEIPFISGKSTTASHSLAANFQEVLSLMKSHNTRLCKSPLSHSRKPAIHYFHDRPASCKSTTTTASAADITDLLIQLQDEFGAMSVEHQELTHQIQEARDLRLQEDLERELDALVMKMNDKGDQISRLRRHHETLTRKAKEKAKKSQHPVTATVEIPCRDTDYQGNGHVEVTTTIRTKGSARNSPGSKQASLNLYKGLKKIQSTLRKDDISWD